MMGLKDLAKQIKKEQKEKSLTVEDRFLKKIDEYLVSIEQRPSSISIKPSSFYKCTRQIWYKLLGFKQSSRNDPKSVRILEVGTKLHEWIQENILMNMQDYGLTLLEDSDIPAYKDEDFNIEKEHNAPDMELKFKSFQYTETYPISAMVDGVFNFSSRDMLFEFKTINSRGFEKLFEPREDHLKQGVVYSICTGINNIMFLYICKDTQKFKAYLHQYTDDQKQWAIEKVREIEDKLLKLELPEKEESYLCRYCNYSKICQKEYCGKEFKKNDEGFNEVVE